MPIFIPALLGALGIAGVVVYKALTDKDSTPPPSTWVPPSQPTSQRGARASRAVGASESEPSSGAQRNAVAAFVDRHAIGQLVRSDPKKSRDVRKLKDSLNAAITEKTKETREQLLTAFQWRHGVRDLLAEADAILGKESAVGQVPHLALHGSGVGPMSAQAKRQSNSPQASSALGPRASVVLQFRMHGFRQEIAIETDPERSALLTVLWGQTKSQFQSKNAHTTMTSWTFTNFAALTATGRLVPPAALTVSLKADGKWAVEADGSRRDDVTVRSERPHQR